MDLPNTVGASRGPTLDEERDRLVPLIKEFRTQIDALIQRVPVKVSPEWPTQIKTIVYSPEVDEAQARVRTSLIEAKMWAGKMLEFLGNPFPPELADNSPKP